MGVPYKEKYVFLPGDRYLAPIDVKICLMVELCPICGFSTFGADVFRGIQIGLGEVVGHISVTPMFDAISVTIRDSDIFTIEDE